MATIKRPMTHSQNTQFFLNPTSANICILSYCCRSKAESPDSDKASAAKTGGTEWRWKSSQASQLQLKTQIHQEVLWYHQLTAVTLHTIMILMRTHKKHQKIFVVSVHKNKKLIQPNCVGLYQFILNDSAFQLATQMFFHNTNTI